MSVLKQFAKVSISHGPTPMEHLPRLSAVLNCNLYIKRDDCTGLAGGGNKTRKLEYLIADAKALNADTLVTVGGIQSNHARQTAAAAAKFGFDCELILEDVEGTPKKSYYQNGNVLLDHLLGANVHRVPEGIESDTFTAGLMASLKAAGKKPYLIPMGGSNEIGSLGYIDCANEIIKQIKEDVLSFDQIILATGSTGTQTGLLAGFIAEDVDIPVLGICVSRPGNEQEQLVQSLLEKTLAMIGLDSTLGHNKVFANGDYYGEGYGISTAQTIEAIKLVASTEGILLDPVYTGKAMAGLIALCRNKSIAPDSTILFIHTGGSQGLFAYQDIFY